MLRVLETPCISFVYHVLRGSPTARSPAGAACPPPLTPPHVTRGVTREVTRGVTYRVVAPLRAPLRARPVLLLDVLGVHLVAGEGRRENHARLVGHLGVVRHLPPRGVAGVA
eukprot:62197-Pyramimonas_sp.AAC.1